MLHFLLIILALLGIWRLASHGHTHGTSFVAGVRRLALVLAMAGAAMGRLIGYVATRHSHTDTRPRRSGLLLTAGPDRDAIVLGIMGFAVVWVAASVLIWIISGFLNR